MEQRSETDMTEKQKQILRILGNYSNGLTSLSLAKIMQRIPQDLVHSLIQLQQKGYLERTPIEKKSRGRRPLLITLTDKGKAVHGTPAEIVESQK